MKQKHLRIIGAITLVLMLLSTFAAIIPASAASADGLTFKSTTVYAGVKSYESGANTFEATVKFAKNTSGRGGVILGNFENRPCASFEVYENGAPRLYIMDASGQYISLVFSNVNLYTGDWVHVSIVRDTVEKKAHCYINGQLKQTLSCTYTVAMGANVPMVLGGDYRSGNSQYFKGSIGSVAVFSTPRTAIEIASDYANGASGSSLLAKYDLTALSRNDFVADLSGNGNHVALPTYNGDELTPAIPESVGGMLFSQNSNYQIKQAFTSSPEVFEAEVYFPASTASNTRGGVILGNYGRLKTSVSFEVYTGGAPRLYVKDASGKETSLVFSNVNLYNGQWTHVAIVRNVSGNSASCYVNGTLAQTLALTSTDPIKVDTTMLLGGDYRSANSVYFRGAIRSLAVYGATRNASQIKADYQNAQNKRYDSLADGTELAVFNLNQRNATNTISDLGKHHNDLRKNLVWFEEKEPVSNYAYTFAVVGDTQIVAESAPSEFHKIYDFILDSKEEKNIQFVFGLGDITNNDTDAEWKTATQNIFRMDGVIPYSLVRGNHDSKYMFQKYLPTSRYASTNVVSYDNTMLNTYQTLEVGEINYLMLSLDYGPSDAVLKWASEVIEAHPYHNVIISTHAYLYRDGTTLDSGDTHPPATMGDGYNNGDHLWEKLMKKHENIVMVLSGHDPCDRIVMTQTPGESDNVVTQLLIDPQGVDAAQGCTGLVALLHFSEDGSQVEVEYYSTINEQYFLTENQFTFEVDVVREPTLDPNPNPGTNPDPDTGSNSGSEPNPGTESNTDTTESTEDLTTQAPAGDSASGNDGDEQAGNGSASDTPWVPIGIAIGGVLIATAGVATFAVRKKKRK